MKGLAPRIGRVWLAPAILFGLALASARALYAQSPSITRPASPNAAALADLYNIIFFIAVGVFLLVEGLIIYAALRFRRRSDDDAPTQVHGNTTIEIVWTLVPVVIVSVLTAFSYRTMNESIHVPQDAMKIEVTGHQWWWEFHYPDAGITTATELYVPVGRPVELLVDSTDVIHSLWVPQLAGKVDAVPGQRDGGNGQNGLWFVASQAGRFEGQCAEFCGTQHAGMRLTIVAVPPDEFAEWLLAQGKPASAPPAGSPAAEGLALVTTKGCQGCHQIDGVKGMSVGVIGPNLTHLMARKNLAGGLFGNNEGNLKRWVDHPADLKPGTLMTDLNLTPEEIADVVAYLETLK